MIILAIERRLALPFISAMDIYAIRRHNLRALIDRHGGISSLSRRTDTSPATISRITKDNPTRDCGNKLARQIETKLGLSSGALDQFGLHLPDHIKDLAETVTQADISAEDAALVRSLLKRLHRC